MDVHFLTFFPSKSTWFRSGSLYSLCSPGNHHYQEIIYFLNFFLIKKGRNRRSKFDNQQYISSWFPGLQSEYYNITNKLY